MTEPAKTLPDQYFEAMGTKDMAKLKHALASAHDIRKFEIELYWKRATYFWLLQAAIFTALGFMWQGQNTPKSGLIPLGLTSIGLLTAVASWFASEGSKFWQENWERHIDVLEDNQGVRLHKTAWVGRDGIRWSVSGTNGWLNIFFAVFWLGLFLSVLIDANEWKLVCFNCASGCVWDWKTVKILSLCGLTILAFLALWSRGSRLEGEAVWPRLITSNKTDVRIVQRKVEP